MKKKLDSYLASGLLAQFQGLPKTIHTILSVAGSSSKKPQSSEEDSLARDGAEMEKDSLSRDGAEMEEVSQCSQGSAAIGHSYASCDVGNTRMPT